MYLNNIFNRIAGGRTPIRPEPYNDEDAYEYIRRIHDYTYCGTCND